MTLNRRVLRRVHSPLRSPCRTNSSLRKKALIRQLNGAEVQFGADSKANLKVVVRVRPFNTREQENNAKCVVDVVDEHMLVFDPQRQEDDFFFKGARQRNRDLNKRKNREQKFAFEKVFNTDSTNHQVYETTTHNLLDTLLSGYNCSVFAYGATGAGKTFTMLGTDDCPGITFLTLMELYKRIDDTKEEKTCEVAVSYLEVYNETVRDLLQPGKLLNLQEVGQQVVVPGLSLHKPVDAEELMVMLSKGNHNRTQHPTDSNSESSRSHAVFQVFVKQQDRLVSGLKSNVAISKLSMIDLAGSERGAATGFKGVRFREGASINKSLLALGNCINALADGQRHIPYRDSKLTRLLKDSLGGNCRSIMIAAISPASTTFEDTFNTLRYANRAKTIKMTIKKNLLNVDQHVSNYVKIVEDLKEEVVSLKAKIQKYEDNEAEWEKERATLTRPATPLTSTTTPLGITDQEKLNFEARIAELEAKNADLEEQLMSKNTVVSDTIPSPETSETQRALEEASREYRAICCAALRLENSQREIHLKIHFAKARLLRMQVISFASQKLDKSIARCHRTLGNLARQLEQVIRQKEEVEGRMGPILVRLDCLQSSQLLPQHLAEKLQANAAISEHQENCQYLGRLVGEGFSEQRASEKLIASLLHTTKQYYVQLRAHNLCTPQFSQIFQNVVDSLDESKIVWADQQSDGDDGSSSSNNEPYTNTTLPSLDVAYFTNFQVNSTVRISPAIVTQERPRHRKSNLKSSSSMVNLPELPSECLAPSGDPRRSPVFPSPVPEEEEVFSPATPITPRSRAALVMPLLSTFSAAVKSPLPVITTHPISPRSYLNHSPGISLRPELRTSQTTPQTPIIRKSEEVLKVWEPPSMGFVSITQGCGITTLKTGNNPSDKLNTTELLDDIQPVDCSINATFSVTPGKNLNTTIDLPPNLSQEKTNSAPVGPNIISVASTVSTLSVPSFRSDIASKPPSANMTLTDIEGGTHLAAVSTIAKNSEVINEKSQKFGSVSHGVGEAESVSSLNQTITVTEDPEHPNKTASRKLFLNAPPQAPQLSTVVLDSTFNVGDESALLEFPDTPHPPVRSSADTTERDSVSPNLANDSHQPSILKSEPPQRSPLQSLTNTSHHTPAIIKNASGEPPKPPPSKVKLSKHKSGMQGGVSTTTLGKTSLLRTGSSHGGSGSMRRSVSTPSLAAAASVSSTLRATKPSPVLKRKFTGGALHRSSSILHHPRTPHMSNQENVPPGSTRKTGIHASLHRETVSSAAKHSFTYAKP